MWANCRAYNPEGTIVRQMGDRLSDTWEKKWYQQGVEAKWEGLMRELKEEDVRCAAIPAPSSLWLLERPCRGSACALPDACHGVLGLQQTCRAMFHCEARVSCT